MTDNFFNTKWFKFSKYEIVGGTIMPSKHSRFEIYDPFLLNDNNKKRENRIGKDKTIPIYQSLLNLSKLEGSSSDKEVKSKLLAFAHTWGVPGQLMHNFLEIILHPMYLPFYSEYPYFNKKNSEGKYIEGLVYDHEIRNYNKKIGTKYIVHNCKQPNEGILSLNKEDEASLNYYIYSTELNQDDPTDLNWIKSNFVHICPQQLSYKLLNGKWQVESKFLTLNQVKQNAKIGDLVDIKSILNKKDFSDPGYRKKNMYKMGNKLEDSKFYLFKDDNYKPNSRKEIKRFVLDTYIPFEFVEFFPTIRKFLEKKSGGMLNKNFPKNVEGFFWPMPGTEKFFRNYGETDFRELGMEIEKLTDWLMDQKEQSNKVKKNKREIQRISSRIESGLRHFTSETIPTIEYDKDDNIRYCYHHGSLLSIIGHIILHDYLNLKSPRKCLVCKTPIYSITKAETKYCDKNTCGSLFRKNKSVALSKNEDFKKLKKRFENGEITKKHFEKNKKVISLKIHKELIAKYNK